MLRASLVALCLGLGSTAQARAQFVLAPKDPSPTPSSQIGAVPPPPFVPQSAPPAAFPVIPAPQSPPVMAPAQAPTVLLMQVPPVAPVAAAAPVMTMASPQFAASPFVNPFVTQAQPQQGVGTVALVGATVIADNPWVVDRILGCIGEKLHKRGMPVLKVAPPGTVVAPAQPAASSPVMLGQTTAVMIYGKQPSKTKFGKWFWGE